VARSAGGEGHSSRHQLRRALLHTTARALRQRRPSPSATPPQRLLLIRPDHLGDLLWFTPALRALRQRLPDAAIAVAVGTWSRPLLAHSPDLDYLLTIEFPGFERRAKRSPVAPYRLLAAEARRLRLWGFDTALVLRDDHWWGALLADVAGIPRRFGYRHPDVAPFLTDSLPLPGHEHAAIGNLRLIDALLQRAGQQALLVPTAAPSPADFPLVFHPGDAAEAAAAALLAPLPDDGGPLVAIHPSAGVPVKLWDEARLAAVADRLADEFGARIILTGGPGDGALAGAVAAQMATAQPLDLTGRTDIATLVALYRRCALVLGPDSGALHLAIAAGAPTIHLYGPADPVKFGPWGDPARQRVVHAGMRCARCGDLAPSRPRGAACMLAITVGDVLAAARPLLAAVQR
jgi:heptosyltransferase-2/heptosyltransferase-3